MIQPNRDCCRPLPEGPWYQVAASFIGPPIAWPYEVACRQPYTGEILVVDLLSGAWGMYMLPDQTWKDPGDLRDVVRSRAASLLDTTAEYAAEYAQDGGSFDQDGNFYPMDKGLFFQADEHRTLKKAAVKEMGPWYSLPFLAADKGGEDDVSFCLACQRPFSSKLLVISEDRWESMGIYSLLDGQWVHSADLDEITIRAAEEYIRRNTKEIAEIAAAGKLARAAVFGDPI